MLAAQIPVILTSWTPARLPGLQLWLDASQITGLVDGDPVATWSDLSGNGNHATQATASKKPLYKVGIVNGLPVVRPDGVDDTIGIASIGAAFQPAAFTMFVVCKMSVTSGSPQPLAIGTSGSTTTIQNMRLRDAGGGVPNLQSQSGNGSTNYSVVGATNLSTAWRVLAITRDTSNLIGYVNGAQDAISTGTSVAPSYGASAALSVCAALDGTASLNGDIHAVLFCDRVLDAANLLRATRYYGARCGLAVA